MPKKNIRPLSGKPLIIHTIDVARMLVGDERICVSTDDQEIIDVVESYGLDVPFIRPAALATDTATSYEVILHAVEFYRSKGLAFENVVLLQPTSPFRTAEDIKACLDLYDEEIDAVVSVKITDSNPYYTLFEEDEHGYLQKSKQAIVNRRQEAPQVLELNGAVYVLNTQSLHKYSGIVEFPKKIKYEMEKLHSVDIDDLVDFQYCEFLINNGLVKL